MPKFSLKFDWKDSRSFFAVKSRREGRVKSIDVYRRNKKLIIKGVREIVGSSV